MSEEILVVANPAARRGGGLISDLRIPVAQQGLPYRGCEAPVARAARECARAIPSAAQPSGRLA